jgi:hypothetical protein
VKYIVIWLANVAQTVQGALEAASRERSTVVIAHRLATVRHAHAIAVLRHGTYRTKETHSHITPYQHISLCTNHILNSIPLTKMYSHTKVNITY